MEILARLRHPRKELAALVLKPGWAKALARIPWLSESLAATASVLRNKPFSILIAKN
jgi:hypothetical protein